MNATQKINKALELLKDASRELKQGDIDSIILSDSIESAVEQLEEDVIDQIKRVLA